MEGDRRPSPELIDQMSDPDRPWDTPEQRKASWKQWAMEQAVKLLSGSPNPDLNLEVVAQRIYLWAAFPAKSKEPKEKDDASS